MLYPSINKIREKVDSRYTLVVLASKRSRDIIDGTTVGVTYEWMLHNIAYAGASILGLDSFKASAESVDIGKTVFDDSHKGFIEHALKTPYIVLFPITAVIDLFINGGYR